MAEIYPNIPVPLVRGYSSVEISAVRKDDVEIGPARFEALSVDVPNIFKVEWNFNQFDFAIFEGWFNTTLTKGAKSFNLDLTVGLGFVPHEVYFLKPYNFTLRGKRFKVKADLLGIEKQFVTPAVLADLELLRDNIGGDVGQWITDFNKFMEVTLPSLINPPNNFPM